MIQQPPPLPGYHIQPIPEGIPGELSKLLEEVYEALDAEAQGSRIMLLVELSDLYGAIQLYMEKYFPGMTMQDLRIMSDITRRAFETGHRKKK